jgi:hypothetical protein
MRKTPLLAAFVLLASSVARAETVEVSSTTLLTVGQQPRYRGGAKPDLDTVSPAYEILSVTARDIQYAFASDVKFVVSGWGAKDLAKRRWDAGTESGTFSADLTTGYVEGRLFRRYVTVRLGRQLVATGVARMLQLDGGQVIVLVPLGGADLVLNTWAGSPTSQRFQTRSGEKSWNPAGGTFAYGGRLGVTVPWNGLAGRGLELGASANLVQDGSDPVRREVGADFRLQPAVVRNLTLAGFGTWSLYDQRLGEASLAATWTARPKLHLTADWRFVEPGLLLARNSILSVFSASTWNELGGGFRYDLSKNVDAGGDYHQRREPGETSGTHTGHDAVAHLAWSRGSSTAGAEVSYLAGLVNGYTGARVFARRELGKVGALGSTFVAADVLGQAFQKKVNGESGAVTGTLSAGLDLPHGFSAVVSGRAGMTPFLEQTFDVMAKLAYNQTYRSTEVR